MAAGGGRLSPMQLYPLPRAAPDGPLLRLVARLSRGWRARFSGVRARNLKTEGAAVVARAAALVGMTSDERRACLGAVRGGLRRDLDDPATQRDSLALAAAALHGVEECATVAECAAALAVMRGDLAAVGGEPDAARVSMLAALALAPWGGGVHLVAGDAARAAEIAARLARWAEPLGLFVACTDPGLGPEPRRAAWRADITCTSPGDLATDALRDLRQLMDRPGDLRLRLERLHGKTPRAVQLFQRGLRCAVLLDAHRLLLDEALRTVALSADEGASQEMQSLALAWDVSALLAEDADWVRMQGGGVALTEAGLARLAEMLAQRGGPWSAPGWRQQRLRLAVVARHVLEPGVHYSNDGPRIEPIGLALDGFAADPLERRLLLDLLAVRHEREVPRTGTPVASMSVMECFLRYPRIGGTLAAVDRLGARELRDLYGLAVLPLAEAPPPPPDADAPPPPTPEERGWAAQARAEHRQAAGRVQKLLSFSGG